MVILYILGKFALYGAVCALAFRMYKVAGRSELSFVASWASLRILIGIAFIFPIVLLDAQFASRGATGMQSYFASFAIMRIFEWLVLWGTLMWRYKLRFDSRAVLLIVVGITASFLSDGLAVITGASGIRLFC